MRGRILAATVAAAGAIALAGLRSRSSEPVASPSTAETTRVTAISDVKNTPRSKRASSAGERQKRDGRSGSSATTASARTASARAVQTSAGTLLGLDEQARMERMAANLLKETSVDTTAAVRMRDAWMDRYAREPDRMARMELVTEMVQLDDPGTIHSLVQLLGKEKDSGVREQIILILGYMRSTQSDMDEVMESVSANYRTCGNSQERLRTLEVISNLPRPEAADLMRTAFTAPEATLAERAKAAEGLFKLAPRIKVDPQLIVLMTDRLKQDARSAATPEDRLTAFRVLAYPGQNNRAFFNELIQSEPDHKVQEFLALAAEEHPTR